MKNNVGVIPPTHLTDEEIELATRYVSRVAAEETWPDRDLTEVLQALGLTETEKPVKKPRNRWPSDLNRSAPKEKPKTDAGWSFPAEPKRERTRRPKKDVESRGAGAGAGTDGTGAGKD